MPLAKGSVGVNAVVFEPLVATYPLGPLQLYPVTEPVPEVTPAVNVNGEPVQMRLLEAAMLDTTGSEFTFTDGAVNTLELVQPEFG